MLERILFQNNSTTVNWWITFYWCAMHKGTIYDILAFKSVDTNRPTIIIITVIFIKKILKKELYIFHKYWTAHSRTCLSTFSCILCINIEKFQFF
jgi:hypothetical protein